MSKATASSQITVENIPNEQETITVYKGLSERIRDKIATYLEIQGVRFELPRGLKDFDGEFHVFYDDLDPNVEKIVEKMLGIYKEK